MLNSVKYIVENKEEDVDILNLIYKKNNLNKNILHRKKRKEKYIIISISFFFIIIILLLIKKYYFFKYSFEGISKIQGINYLNRCLKCLNQSYTFSNFSFFNINVFPKITVIIPVYNCQKSIKLSLISVLNQNMTDFEIIIINDNSNDNSSVIINQMKMNDYRIKIINNHKNMGTLYSRSIGVLNARGRYIFALDNDDIFLNEDVFEVIINIAEKGNYDIVEFKVFTIPNYYPKFEDIEQSFFNFHPNNLILHQPELGIFPISKNGKYFPNDFSIWGKCINTKLYKMSLNALGKKRYSIYNCWTEDISIIFIIFNLADSYIFVNKYGIFHLNSMMTTTFTLNQQHKIFAEIFLLDIIVDFLKEEERYKRYAVLKSYDIYDKIQNCKLSEIDKKYLKSILNKVLDCQYINQIDKYNLKIKFHNFMNL